MDGHPVDSCGLVLPEPSWPDQPGSAGALEPLRRFCNTTNRENGAEAWRTPDELTAWLAGEGLVIEAAIVAPHLTRLVAVREALWVGVGSGDYAEFARVTGELAVRVDATPGGGALAPTGSGTEGVVVGLALAVAAERSVTGELRRLKACHHCRWVFHDTSKNRSGRWCSMTACGGRDKARSYRRRQVGRRTGARP